MTAEGTPPGTEIVSFCYVEVPRGASIASWQPQYRQESSRIDDNQVDPSDFRVYLDESGSFGVTINSTSECTACRRRIAVSDVFTLVGAPQMAGTIHHTDCDDPKLEKYS